MLGNHQVTGGRRAAEERVRMKLLRAAAALLAIGAAGGAASSPAAERDPVEANTCSLRLEGATGAPALDFEITYLSEPILQAVFESEDTRTQVRSLGGGGQVFLVRASARRASDFYPTSFAFAQGKERREPTRSGVIPLDGGFGGRLADGESTRGLLVVSPALDLKVPVRIEYADGEQTFLFTSSEPLGKPVGADGVRVDPIRALEWKIQDLEKRLQAIEEKLQKK